jgi:hypothetical protein
LISFTLDSRHKWFVDWDDDDFSDLAHASTSGEELFTSKITETIDEILTKSDKT